MSYSFHHPTQANASQVGQVAALWHGDLEQEHRREMNQIIHSGDPNTHKFGFNPYADSTKSYDPKAQEALDRIAAKYGK